MIKQTTGILAVISLILLLQSGCAPLSVGPESGRVTVDEGHAIVKELIKSTRSWDGTSLPAYPQDRPEITILRISIPAGTRLDTHSHPVINSGVLISGELTVVTLDGKTLHLKAGDPIVEVVNTWHYGINEGKVPAEIIVFYAGAVGTPITVVKP
ncbi:MAG: cupin domain-containing protein [Deltaproteobacteria bacterium]|nr:cupin domain-containing protein [Deltaproteobacteria bacterium]